MFGTSITVEFSSSWAKREDVEEIDGEDSELEVENKINKEDNND